MNESHLPPYTLNNTYKILFEFLRASIVLKSEIDVVYPRSLTLEMKYNTELLFDKIPSVFLGSKIYKE